jgi:hypothetical protein
MTDTRLNATRSLIRAFLAHPVHAAKYHSNGGHGHAASPAYRCQKRCWRARPAVLAGVILLAAASGGCATTAGKHRPAPRTSLSSGGGQKAAAGGGELNRQAPGGSGKSKAGSSAGNSLAGRAGGVMFGGDLPLAAITARLGRKLAIVRVYDVVGQHFNNPRIDRIMAGGTTVLASLDTFPPHGPSYAAIAAGRQDAAIKSWLSQVEQSAVRYHLAAIYVDFEHEANDRGHHRGLGTPAQFVRAWHHIHRLATAAHLDWNQGGRIHWVMIMTGVGYAKGRVGPYWPGNGEADAIGVDGYNTGGCRIARKHRQPFTRALRPPATPATLFSRALQFAAGHGGLPVFVAEWGSVTYGTATVRVNFIHQMQAYLQAHTAIAAALYWDSQVPPCDYIINSSPPSVTALAGLAHSPHMQGKPA